MIGAQEALMKVVIHKEAEGVMDLDVIPSVRSQQKPGRLSRVTRLGLAGTVEALLLELKRQRQDPTAGASPT